MACYFDQDQSSMLRPFDLNLTLSITVESEGIEAINESSFVNLKI
jgi:hypothetical protein